MSELVPDGRTRWGVFRQDLVSAAMACLRTPWLILLTALLEAATDVTVTTTGPLTFLALFLLLVNFGFYGTQRIWLLRAFNGEAMSARSIWPLTRILIGRFLRLATAGGVPLLGILLALRVVAHGALVTIPGAAVGLAADALLTFVVPVLVFETNSVRAAWATGMRMVRDTWPNSVLYVLTPGVALITITHALARSNKSVWQATASGVVAAEVALVFKGTILRYYLRLRPGTRRVFVK